MIKKIFPIGLSLAWLSYGIITYIAEWGKVTTYLSNGDQVIDVTMVIFISWLLGYLVAITFWGKQN